MLGARNVAQSADQGNPPTTRRSRTSDGGRLVARISATWAERQASIASAASRSSATARECWARSSVVMGSPDSALRVRTASAAARAVPGVRGAGQEESLLGQPFRGRVAASGESYYPRWKNRELALTDHGSSLQNLLLLLTGSR